MNNKPIKAILLIATSCSLFFSCSKPKDQTPPDTELKLTITNELNNPVSGATIRLFSSQDDLLNETGQIGSTATTDFNGQAVLKGLSSAQYFWLASDGCASNRNGLVTSGPLASGIINTATVQLKPTGTLVLSNNSKDPYKIYLNGTALTNPLVGGGTATLKYALTGNYTVRVVQQSGYVINPTDKTYMGTLSCGATLRAVFPN
jgi:hypothetical protein